MKNQDIIKAIAKLDGWRNFTQRTYGRVVIFGEHGESRASFEVPDYINSRDAIVPVIERWGREVGCEIINNLAHKLGIDSDWSEQETSLAILLATPLQLCEALLMALDKWKD